MPYFVYLLECRDGSLYCGIAKNVKKRFEQHRAGKGSKYVASRWPAKIVFVEKIGTLSKVLKREAQIKNLSKKEKWALVRSGLKKV